jgi:hypothetical protein
VFSSVGATAQESAAKRSAVVHAARASAASPIEPRNSPEAGQGSGAGPHRVVHGQPHGRVPPAR